MAGILRRKKVVWTLLFGALFLLPTFFIFAAAEQNGVESLWAVRDTVIVSQSVAGDVIVAAQELRIDAPVAGDVLAVAQTIVINADVKGSVRVVGGTVTIRGSIGRALTVFGNTLTVEKQATVGEYTWASVSTLNAEGVFKGPVMTPEKPAPVPYFTMLTSPKFLFVRLILLFGLYIVGLVFIMLMRRPTAMAMSCMLAEPKQNLGWGTLVFFGLPLACLVLFGTIIGIPLALISIVYWGVMMYSAQVFVSLAIGFVVLHRIDPHHHFHSIMWTLVVGGILWTILTIVPYVGWLVQLFGTIWALGAFLQVQRVIIRDFNAVPEEKKENRN